METSPDYDERVINVVTNARELSPERESFSARRVKPTPRFTKRLPKRWSGKIVR